MNSIDNLPLLAQVIIFIVAAGVVWASGVTLAKTSDKLCDALKLSGAMGGMVFLASATNLPGVAITITGCIQHHIDLVVGNILGGVAMQTLVLVFMDRFVPKKSPPLSTLSTSDSILVEACWVIAILTTVIMAHQLPANIKFFNITPGSVMIILLWAGGLWAVYKAKQGETKKEDAPKPEPARQEGGYLKTWVIFSVASVATLAGGWLLETSGDALAHRFHMDGLIFGATILALAAALPDFSTGIPAVRMKNYELGFSDIIGGNAYLVTILAIVPFITGQSVFHQATAGDIYVTALGLMMTVVYLYGCVLKSHNKILGIGWDSFSVALLYIVGMIGLFFIPE